MVYLPDMMTVIYERLKRELKLNEADSCSLPDEDRQRPAACFNFKFWQEALGEHRSLSLRRAFFKAYLDALALDRWKVKLENYPTWVRRHEQVRWINNHMEKVMPLAQKSLHRREAYGLAIARMETFDRKLAKKKRLCWAVAGESVCLGDKKWRERFEELLPKGATYRFSYSYSSLMAKSFAGKLISQALSLQPSLFLSKDGLWYPKSLAAYDGLIWVGKWEDCPFQAKNIVYCSQELTDLDRHNILKMHNQLKEKIS